MKFWVLSIMVFIMGNLFGQHDHHCTQVHESEKVFKAFPELSQEFEKKEVEFNRFVQRRAMKSGEPEQVYIIPVVFHIIHLDGVENIPDAQVFDAMRILNEDFQKRNPDVVEVIEEFANLASDIKVEFRLAQLDPDGKCSTGINRIRSELTTEGGDEMKKLIHWPRSKYMNVYVCMLEGAAGYTYLPTMTDNEYFKSRDGIVMNYQYIGSIGTSNVNRSRALTHECGHWFNLKHTWGNTNAPALPNNCNGDDDVLDTPYTIGWQNCDLYGVSCSSLDNVQNYMEYAYCSKMFTAGQRDRMHGSLNSSVSQRNNLWSETNLMATGVIGSDGPICEVNYKAENPFICLGESVQFTDKSSYGVTHWEWDFGDGTIVSGGDPLLHKNPTHVFNEEGRYSVKLTVSNANHREEVIRLKYIMVSDSDGRKPGIEEDFEDAQSSDFWYVLDEKEDGSFEWSDAAAYEGKKSLFINNYETVLSRSRDVLLSQTFDMRSSNEAIINYRWAYAHKGEVTDDKFYVYISNDCGESWKYMKVHRGYTDLVSADSTSAPFTPGTGEWNFNELIVSDPAYLTADFQVKFVFESLGGNNFYLDNVNILGSEFNAVSDVGQDAFSFKVDGNPVQDVLRISINNGGDKDLTLRIYDMSGRMVWNEAISRTAADSYVHTANLQHLNAGIYALHLSDGRAAWSEKIIVRP